MSVHKQSPHRGSPRGVLGSLRYHLLTRKRPPFREVLWDSAYRVRYGWVLFVFLPLLDFVTRPSFMSWLDFILSTLLLWVLLLLVVPIGAAAEWCTNMRGWKWRQ